jgi:hypothetical protein
LVVCTTTPAASPEIAWSMRATGIVEMSLLDTEVIDPVTSRRATEP